MPLRAIYIRLTPRELRLLEQMAGEDHRILQDQAAHLVSQAVQKYAADKAYEALLTEDIEATA